MKIVFRVDGSAQIGLGHVMRCLTLASQFMPSNTITFVSRPLPTTLQKHIESVGIELITLPPSDCYEHATSASPVLDNSAQFNHALQCIETLGLADNTLIDILFIDHYQLSAPFSEMMRRYCKNIVVIDDLANRRHNCDVLLDQNLYVDFESRYDQLVPEHCRKLLGPKFAILREEFYENKFPHRRKNHILICFGGSDPSNLTERVADVLLALKSPHISADIVVGAAYSNVERLKEKVDALENVKLHVACSYMATLMKTATVMIGAGGSMHWERAICGIAGIVITLADNQIETTRCLHEKHCCVWLGKDGEVSNEELREAIEFAIVSPQKMRKIADNAAALLSGTENPSFVMDTILNIVKR
ncbi:UDP-2,4-diacetamido-2,4,6-trideoxy-beta-L-altropyranose hydrolase [Alteromonas gracilis]|uniref:UDP-2,4-diacetamido-2,4, 6-trideoxy-beta-L-altropyranose hydrolase n=1 Tax=Alteromonas gracilis TaxID=1479524 RepID=UPI003736290D